MEIKTFETSVKPAPNPRPVFCMILSRQQENERRFRHSHIKLGGRLYGFIPGERRGGGGAVFYSGEVQTDADPSSSSLGFFLGGGGWFLSPGVF